MGHGFVRVMCWWLAGVPVQVTQLCCWPEAWEHLGSEAWRTMVCMGTQASRAAPLAGSPLAACWKLSVVLRLCSQPKAASSHWSGALAQHR